MSSRAPLTAAEILKHPEFEHVVWDLQPAKKGKATVAQGRGGPIQISYEIHGNGPIRLVFEASQMTPYRLFSYNELGKVYYTGQCHRTGLIFAFSVQWIMGLGGFKTAWQRQSKDFGHGQNTNRDQSSKYSCLVFDNRGVGESDKPLSRYSTSEMAKDTLELVDYVGWDNTRQLHIIGSSMGGMIAQELALLVPERIASLSLISTAPKIFNTVGFFENIRNRANIFIPRAIDEELSGIKERMFSQAWLNEPDAEGHFPTNGDRFAAQELNKRRDKIGYTRTGILCQALAAGWHHKSPKQLEELGDKVGRERILVVHGPLDRMISPPHGELLFKELGGEEKGVTMIVAEGKAHGLAMEWRRDLTRVIATFVEKTQNL